MNPRNEKERVYAELEACRSRIANLRREVAALKTVGDSRENAALRREGQEYRKALSNILYRLDQGEAIDTDTLRRIVTSALVLRGLKRWKRDDIASAHVPEQPHA